MKKFALSMALVIYAGFLWGQSKEDMQQLEAFKKTVNTPIVLKIKSTKRIVINKNIKYDPKDTVLKKMDVYLGEEKKTRPLVILIHGKTPILTNPKDWGVYESWGKLLVTEGFVAVTFNHSLAVPGKTLEDASVDLRNLVTYLKLHSKLFNIDTTRIALASFSAGSPLMCYSFDTQDKNVKALVSFYGYLNIDGIKLYGAPANNVIAKFSLTNFIDSNAPDFPPIFIAQAGKEVNQGLNQSINSFISKATTSNIPVTFFNHPTGVHGFDNSNDDDRSREIIQAMLAFLHTHLK